VSPSPPSPEPAAEIGRQLRQAITMSGRQMHDVAAGAAMDPGQLSRLTRGAAGDARISTVARIAAELGMELRIVPLGLGKGADDDPRAA